MTNIKQRAHELLTCDELRGRVPEEVQAFLRDVAALEPHAHELRAWGIFQRIVRRDDVLAEMRNDAINWGRFGGESEASGECLEIYAARIERAIANAAPPAERAQAAQTPVAWTCAQFIEDENGLAIGIDEPRIVWCSDRPDDDGDWHPLYSAPPAAEAGGCVPDGWTITGDKDEYLTITSPSGKKWVCADFNDDTTGYEIAREMLATPPAGAPRSSPDGEVRLWDSQWTNIVNHDNCYRGWSTEDAVAHAVKMTEQLIRKNVQEKSCPPAKASAPEVTGYQLSLSEANRLIDAHDAWIAEADSIGADWSGNAAKMEKLRGLTAALQEENHD